MRQGATLYYLLSDHLGSTSIVTDASGQVVSQTNYKAWGDVRHQSGPLLTEYTFTGQYSYTADFGLMYYNARWYDPALGRFAQADSIVPPGVHPHFMGAGGLDRYAYVNNSPMNYTDPSGHICVESDGDSDVGMAGNCNGGSNPKHKPGLQGPKWNPRLGNSDDESQGGDIGGGAGLEAGTTKSNKPIPPCEQLISSSTCQQTSGVLSTAVFTLDFVATIGTGILGVMLPISAGVGPAGPVSIAEAYAIANGAEGWMGGTAAVLTLVNDFAVTGDSYFTFTPIPQLVVSSDVALSVIFAASGGLDPEPYGDTLINGAALTYDSYRLLGNDPVFEFHIGLGWWAVDGYHEYGH
ncbi:MAG: hypothetical protein HS100_18845 [Anaerolineales bacterium]|nr:hypothetical protein [Anaerolineales bacterium]